MVEKIRLRILLICTLFISSTFLFAQKYEFRAVWIATVHNIDWPSKKGLPVEVQKKEFIELLKMHQRNNMNAVIVQIRPMADAFYASNYEPWSEFLTGKSGQAPFPFYDPLEFMIEESHKRGMEFHAWLNPYRAGNNVKVSRMSNTKINNPSWFVYYGDKKYYNPGLPEVRQYVADVVKDIITRYDVDGIHMDDYFYPYRLPGKDFPDQAAYKKFGNGMEKSDWRRSNCDSIVRMIHDMVIDYKPMIKFGISPFGVWRNSNVDETGSNTAAGQTNYDDLYADIRLWLKEGWIDYVAPQLYWEIGHQLCDFETLVKWWAENSYGKHVYIGHGLYRAIEKPTASWRNPSELPEEINIIRNYKMVQGSIYFSSRSFNDNPNGWVDSLRNTYYKRPAIVPPMDWVDYVPPRNPEIKMVRNGNKNAKGNLIIDIESSHEPETELIKSLVLYAHKDVRNLTDNPAVIITKGSEHISSVMLPSDMIEPEANSIYLAVTSIDRENNESGIGRIVHIVKKNNNWVLSDY